MKVYTVEEALPLLKAYKITSHPESIRRWLRQGTLQGQPPASRKEGWLIEEADLWRFIHDRIPEKYSDEGYNTTHGVIDESEREAIRAEMWGELVNKHIFEGSIEIKKSQVQACIRHNRHSNDFSDYVWQKLQQHKRGYAKPRVPYLLDAFLYDGNRIKLDFHYASIEEQILFPLIEHLRQERRKGK